jgi:hypothetical protein
MTPARPAFAALAAGAAVLAAAALPGQRVGIGVIAVAVLVAAAVAASAPGRRFDGLLFGGLALALASMAAVRDAGWVVAADLGGALLMGALATGGARSWAAVARSPLVLRPLRGLAFAGRAVAAARPSWAGWDAGPVLRGALAGLVLAIVFGALFASADPAFAELAGDALEPPLDAGLVPIRVLLLASVLALAGALALAAARPEPQPREPRRRIGPAECAVALAVVDLVFAAFVAVQVAVLFGGDDHVLRTAGLTYAEYAREGFGQLLAVTVLTLALAAAAIRWTRPGLAPRAALGVLVALTLVVLASALHRLGLYEDAFGLTRLRLAAHAFMLWLGAVLALLLVAVALRSGGWLPRTVTALAGASLVAFSLANPDALIASNNDDRGYLRGLSADAAPTLVAKGRGELAASQRARLAEGDGLSGWNLARLKARRALR